MGFVPDHFAQAHKHKKKIETAAADEITHKKSSQSSETVGQQATLDFMTKPSLFPKLPNRMLLWVTPIVFLLHKHPAPKEKPKTQHMQSNRNF